MLLLFENGGRWDIFRQEKSPNSSYHQSKYCSKVNCKDFYDRYGTSASHFNVNCHLSFVSSMTSVLSLIFLTSLRLCPGTSMPSLRERWVLLHKILIISTLSLCLKAGHKLSSEITFCATSELFVVRWKSLRWICLVPTMDLAKQLRFRISRIKLKQSPRLFHSQTLKSF